MRAPGTQCNAAQIAHALALATPGITAVRQVSRAAKLFYDVTIEGAKLGRDSVRVCVHNARACMHACVRACMRGPAPQFRTRRPC
eukprot:SAG22_NODE_4922_length_1131_cov_1.278101_2_plen_85_part_00